MKSTTALEKLIPSVVNVILVFIVFIPAYFLNISLLDKKLIIIAGFFLYELIFIFANKGRDLGMVIYNTSWEKDYSIFQLLVYNILYTLSFATLLFWLIFPFDIFLINLFFIQLPTVLLKGTTLHGFLSGGIKSVKR